MNRGNLNTASQINTLSHTRNEPDVLQNTESQPKHKWTHCQTQAKSGGHTAKQTGNTIHIQLDTFANKHSHSHSQPYIEAARNTAKHTEAEHTDS